MAVYKVPQDVEADDKLIGFLSMKQFIYVVIAMLLGFAAFQLARLVSPILILPFIPFVALFGMLGLYQRKDQPVEAYFIALINFFVKPHKRKWDQDGIMETVNITVPKKLDPHYSDGLSKSEVKSSLNRLSSLMDTRGWVAKNAEFQTNVVVPGSGRSGDDRLIDTSQIYQQNTAEVHAYEDILDESNNPTAQNFDALMKQASRNVHEDAMTHMNDPTANNLHYNPAPIGIHQKVIKPGGQNDTPPPTTSSPRPTPKNQDTSTMTPPTSDAILELANRRDDNLSVETIAKEAERMQTLDNNETISLH